MNTYTKVTHFFKEDDVKNNWSDLGKSIANLYDHYKGQIDKSRFIILGPIEVIKTIVPEDAILLIDNTPEVDFRLWKHPTEKYTVDFIGTEITNEVSLILFPKKGDPDDESYAESNE